MKEQKYNAFISYRRTQRDVAVAKEIQKSLERFRVPKGIRSASGKERIDRIFRDQEELAITSDLSGRIEEALRASEYLIVICSPGYKQSAWCLHELETFLKLRGPEHVLCVLSEGEPPEVFPELLRRGREEVTAEDGTKLSVETEIEPLACDYRGDFRAARKTELPRLAAVLLGCQYDELVMRRERYRRRRLTAFFSAGFVAAAAAITWLLWSNAQISKNYRQSLISESRLLAMRSLDAFSTQDRLQALNDALQALPNEEMDRPVTDEAQYALSQASYAYLTPYHWLETWRIDEAADIDSFLISRDGKILVCMDHSGLFRSFELDSRKEIAVFRVSGNTVPVSPAEGTDGALLCFVEDGFLVSTDYRTGKENWRTPITTAVCPFSPNHSGTMIAAGDINGVLLLDAQGNEIRRLTLPEGTDEYITELCWSPDDRQIAVKLRGNRGRIGAFEYRMGIFQTETAAFVRLDPVYRRVEGFCFDAEGDFYLLGTDEEKAMRETGSVTGLTEVRHGLHAFRGGEERWRQPLTADGSAEAGKLLFGGEKNDLYLALGSSISRFDRDGTLLGSRNIEREVLSLVSADGAEVNFITEDGMIGTLFTDSGSATLVKMFPEGLDRVTGIKAGPYQELQYVLRSAGNISIYESVSDDSFSAFDGEGTPYRPDNFLRAGDRLLVQAERTLLFYNLETRKMEHSRELDPADAWHLLTENKGSAWLLRISGKDGRLSLVRLDMESGEILSETELPLHDDGTAEGWFNPASRTEAIYLDRYYAAPSPVSVQGEMLAAHDRDAYHRIVLFRLTDGEMRELDVDEAMGDCVLICEENSVLVPSPLTLSPDGKRIFAACTDPRDASRHAVLISTEDGTVTFLPGAPDDLSLVAFTEDGVIFSGTKEIVVCGFNGDLIMKIPYSGEKAKSFAWYAGRLFCAYPGGNLVIYENGEEIRRVPLSFDMSMDVMTGKDFRYEFTPTRLYLYFNGYMNAVSLNSDSDTAVYYASSVLERLEDRRELIAYSLIPEKVYQSGEMNRYLGSFREYSIEELIAMARRQQEAFTPQRLETETE